MNRDLDDFKEFMKRREAAAKAYVSGDAEPLGEISARELPATFFSPKGDFRAGAGEVSTTYKSDANAFEKGSETDFEILQMAADGDIAYWVGFQRASARLKGQAEPVPFNLRVTEIFRRENGDWKLVHRHADVLKAESKEQKA
jgi:ketosteroid isomerase-like protein